MECTVNGTVYVLERTFGEWRQYQKVVTEFAGTPASASDAEKAVASDRMIEAGAAVLQGWLKATRSEDESPEANQPWGGTIDDLDPETVLDLIALATRPRGGAGARSPFASPSGSTSPTTSSASGGPGSEEATPELPSTPSPPSGS